MRKVEEVVEGEDSWKSLTQSAKCRRLLGFSRILWWQRWRRRRPRILKQVVCHTPFHIVEAFVFSIHSLFALQNLSVSIYIERTLVKILQVLVDGSRIDHRPQRDGRKEEVVGESKGRGRSVHRGNGSLYIDIAIAAQASSLAKTSS